MNNENVSIKTARTPWGLVGRLSVINVITKILKKKLPEAPIPPEIWKREHDTTKDEWDLLLKNAEKRGNRITDQGKLICTIAPRRTGKSYDDRQDILESLEKKEHNAGNFHLRLPYWIEKKYWHQYESLTEVAFNHRWRYHLDDAAVDFDCREWANTPPKMRAFVNLLGHFESSFRFNFQVVNQIDVTFLQQCDEIYLVDRWWKLIHLDKWTRQHQKDLNLPSIWEKEEFFSKLFNPRRWRWMNPQIWAMYNTHDLSMLDSEYQSMSKAARQHALEEQWEKRKKDIHSFFDGLQTEGILTV